ncbi:lycopene cyclase domain-containing protein [Luteimicrobium sp. NPDC057192]|uniref:lycopene cyclase domain-containing protein n=1 Tax=Luteimicrobium sp. NPDC057192 TaxID=3346042 RepID=UPI003627A24E
MSYLVLDAVALAVLAVPFVFAARRWAGRGVLGRRLAALGVAAVALLVVTAVFDSLMIAAGLFTYDASALLGLHVGRAPVEDLAYPLGAVLLLPSVWELLGPATVPAGAAEPAEAAAVVPEDHRPARRTP